MSSANIKLKWRQIPHELSKYLPHISIKSGISILTRATQYICYSTKQPRPVYFQNTHSVEAFCIPQTGSDVGYPNRVLQAGGSKLSILKQFWVGGPFDL